MDTVKIRVTLDSFNEHFSIDEWFDLSSMTQKEIYEKMLLFVVDDENQPIGRDAAKKLFRKVPRKEWDAHVSAFYKAIGEAFVSPTSGGS